METLHSLNRQKKSLYNTLETQIADLLATNRALRSELARYQSFFEEMREGIYILSDEGWSLPYSTLHDAQRDLPDYRETCKAGIVQVHEVQPVETEDDAPSDRTYGLAAGEDYPATLHAPMSVVNL